MNESDYEEVRGCPLEPVLEADPFGHVLEIVLVPVVEPNRAERRGSKPGISNRETGTWNSARLSRGF